MFVIVDKMAAGGGGAGGVVGLPGAVNNCGPSGLILRKNVPTKGFFSRMQGAIACAVAPPKLVVDKKSIEKSWKLMDKVSNTEILI